MVHILLSVDAHLWLHRQSETEDIAVINAKHVYSIMHQNRLLLERGGRIYRKWLLEKVISDGSLKDSSSAVIKVKNCG